MPAQAWVHPPSQHRPGTPTAALRPLTTFLVSVRPSTGRAAGGCSLEVRGRRPRSGHWVLVSASCPLGRACRGVSGCRSPHHCVCLSFVGCCKCPEWYRRVLGPEGCRVGESVLCSGMSVRFRGLSCFQKRGLRRSAQVEALREAQVRNSIEARRSFLVCTGVRGHTNTVSEPGSGPSAVQLQHEASCPPFQRRDPRRNASCERTHMSLPKGASPEATAVCEDPRALGRAWGVVTHNASTGRKLCLLVFVF